jgi:multidrug efflux pump subunit AcrA (membrane-fusion protein)
LKSGFKLVFVTLPILAIGAGVLAYMVATSPPPERIALTERATPVRVIIARTQAVTPRIVGFGLINPARTYEAISQVGGTVEYVNPDLRKGAILPAGAVLVRLSPVDFNLAIAQATANIRAAEARLAELTVSQANQTSALKIEQQALALKSAELERSETLFAGGTIPQTVRDAARTAHLVQRQKVQAVASTLALLPTQRAVQSEQIAVYQASLETAKLNLERTELTLPFPARVASTTVEVGQFVRVGQTAAVLDGVEAAEVEAQVSIRALRGLIQSNRISADAMPVAPSRMTEALGRMGLAANVHLRLGQDVVTWTASVDRISDTIDQKTGTLGVIVRVDAAYSGMEPGKRPPLTKGMFVEVTLKAQPTNGIAVPRSALRDGQLLVADAADRLQVVPVDFDLVQDGIALITDGVAEGARIVVSTPSPAIAGMLLIATEDSDLMARLAGEGRGE